MNAIEQPTDVTRFEVIDEYGRAYVRHDIELELHTQDDGRTLKVFIATREPNHER